MGEQLDRAVGNAAEKVGQGNAVYDQAVGKRDRIGRLHNERDEHLFDHVNKPSVKAPRFSGASDTTINRLDMVLSTVQDTTKGKSSVLNYTQTATRSREADFQFLSAGGKEIISTPNIKVTELQDGIKIILRPSTTGPKTIEIQRKNGNKVMEIRYEK